MKIRIKFLSRARVILNTSGSLKFGRILFKRRICLKCKRTNQGNIFKYIQTKGKRRCEKQSI